MEITITNYSGQPLLVFTSDDYFEKDYIRKALRVKTLLRMISNQGWLSSINGSVYADQIDQLISEVKNSLSPQLKFHDFILAGDNAFMTNIFSAPKYLYCIGITTNSDNRLALTFNSYPTADALAKYLDSEDIVQQVLLYIGSYSPSSSDGSEGTPSFYCDNITVNGDSVCEYSLPRSSKFINEAYMMRHNPRLNVMSSETPVGMDFDTSMIEDAKVTTRAIMTTPQLGAPIPDQGLNGNAVVLYIFLGSTVAVDGSGDPVDTTITPPGIWPPIAILLFVLFLIAIIVGILMYLSKSSNINIFGSREEAAPTIRI